MKNKNIKEAIIYQSKSGKIEFRGDFGKETIWASQKQIAQVFNVNVRTINEHLKNIYNTEELKEVLTIRKFRIVQLEGKRNIEREINFYNLDAIISVGYRINSKQATQFRIWATQILKSHLVDGYTINKKRIGENYNQFLRAVSDVKALLPKNNKLEVKDVLDLVNSFAKAWLSLDAYDTESFPEKGATKKQVFFTANELENSLGSFKEELIKKRQATKLFGQEKTNGSLKGIIGNVLQSFQGEELYATVEEKAAHILYFIVKDHPFTDGNKRSGAFAFVWFLKKAGILRASLTPEALTTLTLLVAESDPKEKDRIIGLILILLQNKK
ncbi:MAG: virulence RhuM family protein [Candidatus Moranbacteria bacterium]|nr:virulence RhuM family protein [Candidatus Moranbacteria bacterium]